MKRLRYFLLLISMSNSLFALQANDLNVTLIPDSLLQNANAVYRFYNTVYQRISLAKLSKKVHFAVTILNKEGEKHNALAIYYDKLSSVTDITGKMYRADGSKIRQFGKSDIKDEPAYASYTLFSDSRIKYISPDYAGYPYTVEYSYELVYNGVVGIDTWYPVSNFGVSVQQSLLSYNTPSDITVKFKSVNGGIQFKQTKEKNINSYEWRVQNLKAYIKEPYMPPFSDFAPMVLLSPDEFEYDKTKGNFNTWKTYGKWTYSLLDSRDKLPETAIADIEHLIEGVTDKREKARRIYRYMQGKTRYVNIALGIGGFQPKEAQEVHKYGYGDCKALSNYTRSLLKVAGIEAHYTEIGTDDDQQISQTDFASANQTNHVILCLPLEQDTVWLECTSQHAPFGFIGPYNSNRYALTITPDGGKLVKTPSFRASDNRQILKSDLIIQTNGDIAFSASRLLTNLAYSEALNLMMSSPKEQKESITKTLPLNNLSLSELTITDKSTPNLVVAKIDFSGTAAKYGSSAGNRLFVPVSPFNRTTLPFYSQENRISDIYIGYGITQTDTLTYLIPSEYEIEFIPQEFNLTSEIGSYAVRFQQIENRILHIRTMVLNKGTFPSSSYSGIYHFFSTVSSHDHKKIILKKKQ